MIYANGFGPTNVPVISGAPIQAGVLTTLPVIQIGGVTAKVQFAGPIAPGEFQFNLVAPAPLTDGDQPITATYSGASTQPGTLITIHNCGHGSGPLVQVRVGRIRRWIVPGQAAYVEGGSGAGSARTPVLTVKGNQR